MKINYKKFNEYSEKSQLRIIAFARLLLSMIEIYNKDKIPLSDFERESFSLEEACSLVKKLNEIIDNTITKFYGDSYAVGPDNNRTLETYVYLKGKLDTITIINSFLKRVSPKSDSKKQEMLKKSLKECDIKFNDSLAKIIIDSNDIPLPAYGKEHFFARALFNRKKGEPIDWSIIYNEMQSREENNIPEKENWRYVYDASNDLNKRIQEVLKTKEKLSRCSKRTVTRLH